jgi:hypothetical protein
LGRGPLSAALRSLPCLGWSEPARRSGNRAAAQPFTPDPLA